MSPSAEPVARPGRARRRVRSGAGAGLAVAMQDADADEVTPPLGTAEGWNSERISWFREYHHAAAGLDGPAQQKSWAISCDGELAGSIRLKRSGCPRRHAGDRDLARPELPRARESAGNPPPGHGRAAASGADLLEAETTPGNIAALVLLRSAGAEARRGPSRR